jgi:hypothetical protein
LLLLSDGSVTIGRQSADLVIVAWSVINRPDWLHRVRGQGKISGEDHPKARLSDTDVDLVRELCDFDNPQRMTYLQAAEKFGCSKSTIRDIVKCRTRFKCG